jgi:uncharacterized membrane protein
MPSRAVLSSLVLLAVAAVVQNAYYWQRLPEKVATHFNWQGMPDAWMSKRNAVIVMGGFQLGMPFFLLATTALASWLPSSMVNIPHREYWLHPDRRASSLRYANNSMAWIAVAVSVFGIGVNHLTFIANRRGQPLQTGWFSVLMICFLAVVFAIVGTMAIHFRRPRDAEPESSVG